MTTPRDRLDDAFSTTFPRTNGELITQALDDLARIEPQISDLGGPSSHNAADLYVHWRLLRGQFSWVGGRLTDAAEDRPWFHSLERFLQSPGRTRERKTYNLSRHLTRCGSYEEDFVGRLTANVAFYCLVDLQSTDTPGLPMWLRDLRSLVRELHEAGVSLIEVFDAVLFDTRPHMVLYWGRCFTLSRQIKSRAEKQFSFLRRFRASAEELIGSRRFRRATGIVRSWRTSSIAPFREES